MSWKLHFGHGLLSGALSGLAAVVYKSVYSEAFLVDFSKVMANGQILFSSMFGCLLMALGYGLLNRWKPGQDIWFGALNVIYALLSFLSIIGIFSFSLPYEVESPELFPGMAIPMHFFPLLAFLTLLPFFRFKVQS